VRAERVRNLLFITGWPARIVLLGLIRAYRASLGRALGSRCRFHPSCSAYAEAVIGELGVFRGLALSVWRVARCSPLTRGGVDYPPARRGHRRGEYENLIRSGEQAA
jgi:putative membrane protein insertion efficiency factor